MNLLNLVTINILVDFSRWKERRDLLVEGIAAHQPDLLALQEVRLPENPAHWIADQIGLSHVHLCRKTGSQANKEAIAILSRFPIEAQSTLDLGSQNRVAQYIRISIAGQQVIFVNTHLFWQPGNSPERLRQAGRLLKWLQKLPPENLRIICGDFNGTPETTAIALMRQHFKSAFAAVHGAEPEYSCPTPLPRSPWSVIRTILGFVFLLRLQYIQTKWRGTLDYIFIDNRMEVLDSYLILTQPSPTNPRIYASDHFGIFARVAFGGP